MEERAAYMKAQAGSRSHLLGGICFEDAADHHHHYDGSSSTNNNTKHRDESNSSSSNNNNNNNRTTDAQTMMHILKANIGTGILAMPNAFKNVGLWIGFILIPIIGAICIHCMNILIASHNHLCDRFNYESLDYDQVAALGLACGPKFARRLAKKAHIVVTTFLIFTQFGFCCVYIMFVIENLQVAILNLFQIEYTTTTLLIAVFPIIGLTSCTSNLNHLARISTLANILQLTGLALIFFDLIQFHTYDGILFIIGGDNNSQPLSSAITNISATNIIIGSSSSSSPIGQRPPAPPNVVVNQWVSPNIFAGLPLFFATAVYAFEGIGVVLPLIKEMQYPEHISGLNGVLNTSMSMVALLYMGMGFFGYGKYGQFVEGSITLNLPQTTLNELVRLVFAIAIGLSYSLQFYVPWTIIWPQIDEALFYSYRPRVHRDKLQILSKLSAENQWALEDSDWQQSSKQQQQQQQQTEETDREQSQAIGGGSTQVQMDGHSTASTFATSYTMSTTCPLGQSTGRSRRLLTEGGAAGLLQYGSTTPLHSIEEAGAFRSGAGGGGGQLGNARFAGRLRNRLADVTEQEHDDCSMPEVQWRPPPRSMRGKRKLVRYTVILLSVSFTFVAAALIPRLDLFISLIGALASSCLAIIFPAIIQLCTFWSAHELDSDQQQQQQHQSGSKQPTDSRGFWWTLFVCKNSFLLVFGILGLITGSWISISQLGATYMGIEAEAE